MFLLDGFTIQNNVKQDAKILVGTIKGYLAAVNKHYRMKGYHEPFDAKDESDASKLLKEQKKYEDEPAKRGPLTAKMIVEMCRQAKEDPLGFKAAVYEFTQLGSHGGFRQQEFAMDSKSQTKYYVKPNGNLVVRAFTVRNFIFYDAEGIIISKPLRHRSLAKKLGTLYDIQKNRMNNQTIKFDRVEEHPDYCPVEMGLRIYARAEVLGCTDPEDPLCVYKDSKGEIQYLTGTDVTQYFRDIARTVTPNITDEELKLISTHSIRVYACVLLHEAGKDGPYIKLRLRWLSNCFEVYLRNTDTITAQHKQALSDVHNNMAQMALAAAGMNEIVAGNGTIDLQMDDLEDED